MGGNDKWHALQRAQAYRLQQPSDHIQSIQCAQECISQGITEGEVTEAFAVLGHMEWENERYEEALAAYDTYQEWEPPSPDPLLLCRLGGYSQQEQQWAKAEQCFLLLTQVKPCASAWLGAGMSLMQQEQLPQALRAFQQANLLDNTNPRVWGGLTMLHLRTNTMDQARNASVTRWRWDWTTRAIFQNIGLQYMKKGCLQVALEALTRCLSLENSVSTLVLLGDVYGALNKVDGLLSNYQQAYELLSAQKEDEKETELKVAVGKRIVTALMALGKQEEARKYLGE